MNLVLTLNLFLTLTFISLDCVPSTYNMAGIDKGKMLPVMELHCQNRLVLMTIPDGMNMELALTILGNYRKWCRTLYWLSHTEAILELMFNPETHPDIRDEVLKLSGYQDEGTHPFLCTIKKAEQHLEPQILSEYAHLLVYGEAKLRNLQPDLLYYNSQFIDNPQRIPTPTPPHYSAISDVALTKSPPDFVTMRKYKKKIQPKEKLDFSTPLGNGLLELNQTYPPTQPRTSRYSDYIPNICTPSAQQVSAVVAPVFEHTQVQTGDEPTPTGIGGPPDSESQQVPRNPWSDLTSNTNNRTKPPESDPETQQKSSSETNARTKPTELKFSLTNPFVEHPKEPPQIPRVTTPIRFVPNLTENPLTRPITNPPTNPAPRENIKTMSTPALTNQINNLIREYKQRTGDLPNNYPVPEDQRQGIPLGGLVGDAGGMGNHESGPGTEVPKARKPTPCFESTNIVSTTNPFHADMTRANVSTIAHPQIPDYSVLQTSMQAMSESLLKTILKEGIVRKDTPKLPVFTGKGSDEKISWRRWELQVKGLDGVYEDRAIKEAMNKALQGDAAIVADSLEDDCTWQELLKALKAKFAVVTSMDVMMRTFFQITQGNDSVSQFAIQLEKVLGNIRVCHPTAFSAKEFSTHLRNRLFNGMSDRLRDTLRYKYNQGCSYEDLLLEARQIEGEKINKLDTVSDSTSKLKAKASVGSTSQETT